MAFPFKLLSESFRHVKGGENDDIFTRPQEKRYP